MTRQAVILVILVLMAIVGLACGGPDAIETSEAPTVSTHDQAVVRAFEERAGPHVENKPREQPPLDEIGAEGWGRNIELIAHNDLGGRGMNSAVALTRSGCAYVGSRNGEQGILVLDISNPRDPTVVTQFGLRESSTSRELRTVEDLDLLIVQHYALKEGADNVLDFFDISQCRQPVHIAEYRFRELRPHEFFVWRDPNNPSRLLLYVSRAPYLNVIDASDVRTEGPVEVASFHLRGISGHPNANLHSMSVSDDGTRVYMADLDAGFYVMDSTPLARNLTCDSDYLDPNPCLMKLNSDPRATLIPDGDNYHSIVLVPGVREDAQVYAITGEEIGRPSNCPWGWARVLNVTEGPQPRRSTPAEVATFRVPENLLKNCTESYAKTLNLRATQPSGRFTSHNPTVLRNLVLQTWYAGGLRIYDISKPSQPVEVGVFFPRPVEDTEFVSRDDQNQVSLWSYPVIMDGLIYVTGINEGLLVLKYDGPGHEEIDGIVGPCAGNASPVESIGQLTGQCFD